MSFCVLRPPKWVQVCVYQQYDSYFNLSDSPTIEGTRAKLSSKKYLPIDATAISLGSISDYPLDVVQQFDLGASEPKIDNCFVMEMNPANIHLDTRQDTLNLLGLFSHTSSKIHLEVYSTEPAFQFYTGDNLDMKGTPSYGRRAGFCVEPGRFINAINQPEWQSMSLLQKGQIYGSKIVYKAWKQ
jgi:aldose 1-epimerase